MAERAERRRIGAEDRRARPAIPAPAGAPPVRRAAAALVAALVAVVALIALVLAYVEPAYAPFVAPLVVLIGAAGLWGAATVDRRRLETDALRLAGENRRLSDILERLADNAWELHESEERYNRDMSARRHAEAALEEARLKAEAANQAKSRFLATVSHEFRTPLNGILGLTGLLRESGLGPDQETYARGVQSSGEALLALIDDMLDFAKIEAGRLDLHPEPTALADLLQEIAELLAARAHGKGIDIAAEAGPGLPATVSVDAPRLRQVLVNLAGNGVKFTETGGVTLTASPIAAEGGRARIRFAVEDSGPGVAPGEEWRIFDEFVQGDGAINRRYGGAGLGLAICRRIVRGMGGELTVDAAPGRRLGVRLHPRPCRRRRCRPARVLAPWQARPRGDAGWRRAGGPVRRARRRRRRGARGRHPQRGRRARRRGGRRRDAL